MYRELYKSSAKLRFTYDEASGVASLILLSAEHIDSGKYRCEARNRLGRVHTDCRLTVNGQYPLTAAAQGGMSGGMFQSNSNQPCLSLPNCGNHIFN